MDIERWIGERGCGDLVGVRALVVWSEYEEMVLFTSVKSSPALVWPRCRNRHQIQSTIEIQSISRWGHRWELVYYYCVSE